MHLFAPGLSHISWGKFESEMKNRMKYFTKLLPGGVDFIKQFGLTSKNRGHKIVAYVDQPKLKRINIKSCTFNYLQTLQFLQ